MEVCHCGQQLCASAFQPLRAGKRLALRTEAMPTRVVGNALMAAGIALLDMTAERGGAAQVDGAHRAALGTTEGVGMGLPVVRAAAAEDVRHLERRSHRRLQKYSGAGGWGGTGAGCGSRSKGLVVAHTVLVASLRYRAVVAMLRCPMSSWILRTSAPVSSR